MRAYEMASLVWPLRARHVTLLARPTPGFKPKPQGPRPNSSSPGMMAWAFSPNASPIPRILTLEIVNIICFGPQLILMQEQLVHCATFVILFSASPTSIDY
ncbi:hypothetical protein Hanom_Chr00s126020g01813521 [Helianthus anomalus]